MRVEVSDPGKVPDLVEFLTEHDAYVSVLGPGLVEVGFVGSFNVEQQAAQTERRLREWMATHPKVVVVVTDR
jgi:hypothetical protein